MANMINASKNSRSSEMQKDQQRLFSMAQAFGTKIKVNTERQIEEVKEEEEKTTETINAFTGNVLNMINVQNKEK